MRLEDLLRDDPADLARRLAATAQAAGADAWMAALAQELERQSRRDVFTHWLASWDVSDAEAGRLFGVTRQAIAKWRRHGVPQRRLGALAELGAVTDLLEAYLRRDRIPAVVRRPAEVLGGRSMLALVAEGRTAELLVATRRMFDLRRLDAA